MQLCHQLCAACPGVTPELSARYAYPRTCIRTHVRTYMHTHIMHTCSDLSSPFLFYSSPSCMYVCMYVCMYTHIYTRTLLNLPIAQLPDFFSSHTHTHTHRSLTAPCMLFTCSYMQHVCMHACMHVAHIQISDDSLYVIQVSFRKHVADTTSYGGKTHCMYVCMYMRM
jgi:hypothetical protein